MNGLQDQELRRLSELLEAQRLDIERRLAALRAETQPVGLDLPIGRLSRMDATQQQEMAAGQQRRIEQERQQIDAARQRIEQHRYGRCLRCQNEIPCERLKVRPTTTLCLECQGDLEKKASTR
jgi:DnaK suppressor protein